MELNHNQFLNEVLNHILLGESLSDEDWAHIDHCDLCQTSFREYASQNIKSGEPSLDLLSKILDEDTHIEPPSYPRFEFNALPETDKVPQPDHKLSSEDWRVETRLVQVSPIQIDFRVIITGIDADHSSIQVSLINEDGRESLLIKNNECVFTDVDTGSYSLLIEDFSIGVASHVFQCSLEITNQGSIIQGLSQNYGKS